MKYLLAALLLVSSISLAPANEPPKRFVQFDQREIITQALQYLKKLKPDQDPQKLVFHGIQFFHWATPAGYIQEKKDGSKSYVKVADNEETLSVIFKVLGTEENVSDGGVNTVRYKSLNVNFPRPAFAEATVSDGTIAEYVNPAK